MFSWVKLKHLQEWTGGRPNGPFQPESSVQQISTDTRSIKKGDIYLALRGNNFDGNAFTREAEKAGASALILEKPSSTKLPTLIVEDSLRALVSIGENLRKHFKGKVIAVTGSAGKSSTRSMIATLCGDNTVESPASFNNLMGVSRTLFLPNDTTEKLVLEMGMNALLEIKELCDHFSPQMGIITNIGDAHIGKLGNQRNIWRAKKELFDSLSEKLRTRNAGEVGVGLNVDDPLVREAFDAAFKDKKPRIVSYSAMGAPADIRVVQREMDAETGALRLTCQWSNEELAFSLPLFGLHHAQNFAAAIAGALLMDNTSKEIQDRAHKIRPAPHRGEIVQLKNGSTLIDECYNSNPSALKSSLQSLCRLSPSRRRVLVLGEMRELGEFGEDLHQGAGEYWVKLQRQTPSPFALIAVGPQAQPLVESVKKGIPDADCDLVPDGQAALRKLMDIHKVGDILFVKGSRATGLDLIISELLKNFC